jgi:hypothetical protein
MTSSTSFTNASFCHGGGRMRRARMSMGGVSLSSEGKRFSGKTSRKKDSPTNSQPTPAAARGGRRQTPLKSTLGEEKNE